VASVRCRRSWRRARSDASEVACGPAASSANVMADTASSRGRRAGSITSRSITTDVSTSARACRRGSGTRCRILADHGVVLPLQSRAFDPRRASVCCSGRLGPDECPRPHGNKFADRYAVARNREGLAPVQGSHDSAAVVAEFALSNTAAHDSV